MNGLNKVMVIGRLGQNPEAKAVGDTMVCNFSVATSEKWKDKQDQDQEKTEWHRIVVWGKLAEICAKYLTKGKQVYLEGKLQTRSWEDKEGVTKYTTEIVATQMQFLGDKAASTSDSSFADQGEFDNAHSTKDLPNAANSELPF